ncbi:MerR family transcriptional regulator [Martelella soudanensis]|uniref:MerR family transcriptional regulator n=1 Tax=unclassified Martelella TaxID=2629616 RepID=UPI0015DE9737|nr:MULTISPECIES: MerR family DNA-binding transcriptional regulator [unclassified Martelella]
MTEQFLTVTQLAEELGLTPRALRFYETKGLITPGRAGTTRIYTQRDRARLILILRGKRLGFSLQEIKSFLDLYNVDGTQHKQMKALLQSLRERIANLEDQRQAIDQTLAELRRAEQEAEARLAGPVR